MKLSGSGQRFNGVFIAATMVVSMSFASCGASTDASVSTGDVNDDEASGETANNHPVDTSVFALEGFSVAEVGCTLSHGEASTCYQITISGFPADRDTLGPYCPRAVSSTADEAGVWFDNGVLYDLSGDFVSNLAQFYGDNTWQLYDEQSGVVNVTTTQAGCVAAAQPNVPAEYNNFCVECDIAYFKDSDGDGVASTYLIPKTPVTRSSPGAIGNSGVGIALNGVKLEAAAPVDAILGGYTIAAFDDCVGHVNPYAGYHYHGANHGYGDCPAIDFETDGHGGLIGYALDGFGIYAMLDANESEATDLDYCRGHSDDVRGYHYHTAGPGENAFIGCFSGEVAQ